MDRSGQTLGRIFTQRRNWPDLRTSGSAVEVVVQRFKRTLGFFMAVLTLTAYVAAQKPGAAVTALEAAKQRAIVTGDVNAAIKQYRTLADRYAKSDPAVAAMALVLMAKAYEEQGSAEARRIYSRILKQYPNEKEAVTIARTRLDEGDPSKGPRTRTLWTGGAFPGWGRLSPDGRFFTHKQDRDLFVHEIATGTSRNLTNYAKDSSDIAEESVLSPDGKRVAYFWARQQDGRREVRIAIANLTGDAVPRVLFSDREVNDLYLQDWSPDGKWLAVELYRDSASQLALIAIADGSVRVLKSLDTRSGRTAQSMYFSRDGKYIGYDIRQSNDERHVFVLPLDGGPEVAVVRQTGDNQMVGWSPDGQWLLYRSDRTGTVDLWAIGVANGKPQGEPQRVKANLGANFHAFGWAPNGALYYWTSTDTRPSFSVYTATLDRSNGAFVSAPLPSTRGYQENISSPVWSPDGTRIAYLSALRDRQFGRPDELIIRTSSGTTREIPLKQLIVIGIAAWTPDGQSVILSVLGGGDVRTGIYRANVETGEVSRVGTTEVPLVSDVAWLPDGRSFLALIEGPKEPGIYRIDAQSGAMTMLVSSGANRSPGSLSNPRLAPDGRTVYYRRAEPPNSGEATFIARDLATGNEREVIPTRAVQSLNLSPDGQYIATPGIDPASNSRVVLLVPSAGGQPRELARVPSGVKPEDVGKLNRGQILSVLAWDPDGRSMLVRKYVRDGQQDELFVLSLDGQQSGKTLIPRTLPQGVSLSPDRRQMVYTVRETALPAVTEVSALENFLPRPAAGK
jgi:Tol biopolymer transport system component